MLFYVVGVPLLLLGLTMMMRGWVYTLRPDGAMAEKRKKVNLKRGFTTDMKLFGRKVRRLGLMLALLGGFLVGWQRSEEADTAATTSASPTTATATTATATTATTAPATPAP
jgi:TRAP-type C4-dicarboxylate transport system permease large subunit